MKTKETIEVHGKIYLLVPADDWVMERLKQEQAILKKELHLSYVPRGRLVLAIVQHYLEEVDERDEELVTDGGWKYLD